MEYVFWFLADILVTGFFYMIIPGIVMLITHSTGKSISKGNVWCIAIGNGLLMHFLFAFVIGSGNSSLPILWIIIPGFIMSKVIKEDDLAYVYRKYKSDDKEERILESYKRFEPQVNAYGVKDSNLFITYISQIGDIVGDTYRGFDSDLYTIVFIRIKRVLSTYGGVVSNRAFKDCSKGIKKSNIKINDLQLHKLIDIVKS